MAFGTIALCIIVIITYGGMGYLTIRYPKQVVDLYEKIKKDISNLLNKIGESDNV